MTRILLTGGGAPGFSGILKDLRTLPDLHITACDAREEVVGKVLADDFFTCPMGDDPHYVDVVLGACQKRGIHFIIPITTKELIPLSDHRDRFRDAGIKVMVSELGGLRTANSKCALYQHLVQHQIEVPRYGVATNVARFESIADQFTNEGVFTFKPCISNGSRGFRIVREQDKLRALFEEKPNQSVISKQEAIAILSEGEFPSLLLSEYLPGDEYSIDCLLDQSGDIRLIIPRKRIRINNGISVEGMVENNSEVIDYCRRILETLDLSGPIGIQVKYSTGNKPLLLEINPRLQGSSSALSTAGAPFAALAFQLFMTGELPKVDIAWGTHFYRQYSDYS